MLALAWNILPVAVQRKTKCKYSVKQSLPNKKDEFLWFEIKPSCLTIFVSGNISRVCHIFTNIMFCTISGILVYIQIVHCQCVHAQMSSQQPAWEWRLTLSPKSPAPPRAGLMAYGQAMKGRSRWTALPIVYMHQCQHSHQLRPFILAKESLVIMSFTLSAHKMCYLLQQVTPFEIFKYDWRTYLLTSEKVLLWWGVDALRNSC